MQVRRTLVVILGVGAMFACSSESPAPSNNTSDAGVDSSIDSSVDAGADVNPDRAADAPSDQRDAPTDAGPEAGDGGDAGNPDAEAGPPQCTAPLLDCDGDPTNGCETDVRGNLGHCGACGVSCTNAAGQQSCVPSAASPGFVCQPTCSAGADDCDGDPSNGCETSLQTVANCGGCGVGCSNANGTTSCGPNALCLPVCQPKSETDQTSHFGDCNDNVRDGCETDTRTTLTHCGACDTECTNEHGTTSCVNGLCEPVCDSSFRDCNNNPIDGCESNPEANNNTCGSAIFGGTREGDLTCGFSCPPAPSTEFFATTGTGSRFFQFVIEENSICPANLEHEFDLVSPAGVDYDLHFWKDSCGSQLDTSGDLTGVVVHKGANATENGKVTVKDEYTIIPGIPPVINDPEDTKTYRVEIRFKSGDVCVPWSLSVRGRGC